MANAMEEALSRASAEQRARNEEVIEAARRNIPVLSTQEAEAMKTARQAEVIEEARHTIPFDTMRDADSVDAPNIRARAAKKANGFTQPQFNPDMHATVDDMQRAPDNNYQSPNAVDVALARGPEMADVQHGQDKDYQPQNAMDAALAREVRERQPQEPEQQRGMER